MRGPPAVGQLDKGEGGGGRGGHLGRTGTLKCGSVAFQGPPKNSGVLLTICLVFREQRDRALGHRRKGSKAKRLLQVMFFFSKKTHPMLHNSSS